MQKHYYLRELDDMQQQQQQRQQQHGASDPHVVYAIEAAFSRLGLAASVKTLIPAHNSDSGISTLWSKPSSSTDLSSSVMLLARHRVLSWIHKHDLNAHQSTVLDRSLL